MGANRLCGPLPTGRRAPGVDPALRLGNQDSRRLPACATLQWRAEGGLLKFRVRGALANPSFSGTHSNVRTMDSRRIEDVPENSEIVCPVGRARQAAIAAVSRPRRTRAPPRRMSTGSEAIRAFVGHNWGRGTRREQTLRAATRSVWSALVGDQEKTVRFNPYRPRQVLN